MPSPETTDWQREVAAEIKRVVECPTHVSSYTLQESSSQAGNRIVTRIYAEMKPTFRIALLVKPDRFPNHIPIEVTVAVEKEAGGEVHCCTLDCRWVQGNLSEKWHYHIYQCTVV